MPTTSRLQLALNVADIDAAITFYEQLFGVAPTKQRPGYANFAIADPPLKLVLFEDPAATSALNHLGVELPSADDVAATAERLRTTGLTHRISEQERCCHSIQDKVWVDAPEVPLGAWEFYTVLADDPTQSVACDDTVCGSHAQPVATADEDGKRAVDHDRHIERLAQFDLYTEIHDSRADGLDTQLPIVLVHGSWTDASSWGFIAPALARERLVVAYDRRGHSRSPWPHAVTRRQDEDDLIDLIELAECGPVYLVGNSYGAAIALAVAARRPDLVAGVVAHEPPLLGAARPGTDLGRQADDLRSMSRSIAQLIDDGHAEDAARQFTEIVLGAGAWDLLPDDLQASFVANASTFAGMVRRPGWDVPAEPSSTPVPIVLTAGTESPAWLPAIVDELTSRIYTHAERQTYEGAGHVPHLTHPADVVATINRLAATVGGDRTLTSR